MKILVSYRGIPQSPGWATGDMVIKAFRALGHEAYPYAKYYQQNRWVDDRPPLDSQDWDLILFMECNDGDPQYPELKVTRARKTACWLFDTSYHQDRYRGLVSYFSFDHIFLANPLTIQEYKVWGYNNVHYLPYACDRELHGRPLEYPKNRDVVLVGSIRDDRRVLANALAGLGVDLQLVGGVFREQYIDALASARIVVNQNPSDGCGLLNMRFFESMAAGSILFNDNTESGLNVLSGLQSGAVPYCSLEHLASSVQTFLQNKSLYEITRSRAQQIAFDYNTYIHRCQEIIKTVFP